MEEVQEIRVGRQTTEEGAIESVHCLAEASEQQTSDQLPCDGAPYLGRILDEGSIEGFAALDDLDFCDFTLDER